MATMVSVVLNMPGAPIAAARAYLPDRDDHRLQERVADALGRHLRIFGHRQVHEPARVRIERTHLLRRAESTWRFPS